MCWYIFRHLTAQHTHRDIVMPLTWYCSLKYNVPSENTSWTWSWQEVFSYKIINMLTSNEENHLLLGAVRHIRLSQCNPVYFDTWSLQFSSHHVLVKVIECVFLCVWQGARPVLFVLINLLWMELCSHKVHWLLSLKSCQEKHTHTQTNTYLSPHSYLHMFIDALTGMYWHVYRWTQSY